MHTYRITRLGLWNARAAGHDAEAMIDTLERFAKFPVPQSVTVDIRDTVSRYGRLVIRREERPDAPVIANSPTEELERLPLLLLTAEDPSVLAEVIRSKRIKPLLGDMRSSTEVELQPWARGQIKQELVKLGWPAEDLAGYTPGQPHPIDLDTAEWHMRPYQEQAVDTFFAQNRRRRPALWCGQDARRRRGDGDRQGDHAHPRDEHRLGAAVAHRGSSSARP